MPTFFVLILWFLLSFVIASAAHQRGRSPVSWFLLSIITTPVLAALLLLLFPIRDRLAVSAGSEMPPEIVDDDSPDQTHPMLLLIFLCLVGAAVTTVWVLASDRKSYRPNVAVEQTTLQRTTYEQVTTMPCVNLLNAFNTRFFSELADPIIAAIGEREGGMGSAINITSYALTECRMNEGKTIGQAIESLLEQKRRGRLPRIPVGGATNDPQVQASWTAFEKWIRHTGPKPNLK